MFLNCGFFRGWGTSGGNAAPTNRFDPGPDGDSKWQALQVSRKPLKLVSTTLSKVAFPFTALPFSAPGNDVGGVRSRFSYGFGRKRTVLMKLVYRFISAVESCDEPNSEANAVLKAAKLAWSPRQW